MNETRALSGLAIGSRFALRLGRGALGIFLGLFGFEAVAAPTIFSNSTPIVIADGGGQPGVGNPYPSQIEVTGMVGVVKSLTVTIHDFSHTWPDDLALMLVSPDGDFMVIQSDAGGDADASNLTYTLSDSAPLPLSNNLLLGSGTYRPTSYVDDDPFPTSGLTPPPADCKQAGECPQAAPAGTATLNGTFGGGDPNGTWRLYAIDCCGDDTGTIGGGWSIALETGYDGFSNTTPIVIADAGGTSGLGAPYPSQIEVAGLDGVIDSVAVTMHGLTHTRPDDLAILLVAPDDTFMVLQSNAGGATDVTNRTWTLSDAAASGIADGGPLGEGTWLPSSYGDNETFPLTGAMPPPADCQPSASGECPQPAPAGSATLNGTFGGLSPNGTWSLYVVDCCSGDSGSIAGGWSIVIETRPEGFYNPNPIVIADSLDTVTSGIGDPYPSQIEVTGLTGEVADVRVTIHGFTHTYPQDLALMLVGPDGTFMVIHSDAGGETNVTGVTYTLSDAALVDLPAQTPLNPGTYRPTSYGDDDMFPVSGGTPPPADCQPSDSGECPQAAPAGSATLGSIFGGLAPNGTWSLYAIDCCAEDMGSIVDG